MDMLKQKESEVTKENGNRGDTIVAYTMVGCLFVLAYLVFTGAL